MLLKCSGRHRIRPIMNTYVHHYLKCHGCGEPIYLPHPIPALTGPNPAATARARIAAVFVCTRCGHVSAYWGKEILGRPAPTPDPHQRGIHHLYCIEVECDGQSCDSPKVIHVDVDVTKGIAYSAESAQMKDWKTDDTALCLREHRLCWNPDLRLYVSTQCDSPF